MFPDDMVHNIETENMGTTTENAERQDPEQQRIAQMFVNASDVEYTPPQWLIKPYIQIGKGTLIQADPGTGKTAFACAVAAAVTTGGTICGLPVEISGDVLMLSVEDDPER